MTCSQARGPRGALRPARGFRVLAYVRDLPGSREPRPRSGSQGSGCRNRGFRESGWGSWGWDVFLALQETPRRTFGGLGGWRQRPLPYPLLKSSFSPYWPPAVLIAVRTPPKLVLGFVEPTAGTGFRGPPCPADRSSFLEGPVGPDFPGSGYQGILRVLHCLL